MNKLKKPILIILLAIGLLLIVSFGFYFLRNKNLSVTEELMTRFKTIDSSSAILKQDSKMWWNNNDGYSLLASTTESVVVVKTWNNQKVSEKIPDEIFKPELLATKEVFEDRGFVLNKNNSSANMDDQKFYDYVQAYEKDGYLCTVTVNGEVSSYPISMGYHLFVSCTNKLKEAEIEQLPFLEALNLKNKEEVVELKNSESDYFHVEISARRAGEAAVLKKENGTYRVLLISQEAPNCGLIEREKIPALVLSSIGSGDCYDNRGQYKFRVDKTDYFSYSLKGSTATVSKEILPFDFTAAKLETLADECGTKYEAGYFDNLIAKFKDVNKVVYNFKYQGESLTDTTFTVTVLPNKLDYVSPDKFKKDFDQCFVAGNAYPFLISKDWLIFVNSCASGATDDSGLIDSCGAINEAVVSTLKLN